MRALACPRTDARAIASLLEARGIPTVAGWLRDAGPVWAALAYGVDLTDWTVTTNPTQTCAFFTHPTALPILAVAASPRSRPFWAALTAHRADLVLAFVPTSTPLELAG